MIDRLYEFSELQMAYEFHSAKLRRKKMWACIWFACVVVLAVGVALRVWG